MSELHVLKNYIKLIRGEFFIASLLPVLIAQILSVRQGHSFSAGVFLLVAASVVCVHGLTNVVNEYYDYKNGVDTERSSGVRHLLVEGMVAPAGVRAMISVFAILCVSAGLWIYYLRGIPLLILGAAGMIGGYCYTAPPAAYKYRGFGEGAVFLLMGPMLLTGAYGAITGEFSMLAVILSIPAGFLIAAVLNSNNIRDIEEDTNSGIITSATVLGLKRSRIVYIMLLAGAFIWIPTVIATGIFGQKIAIAVLALPLALMNIRDISSGDSVRMARIDIQTVKLYIFYLVLLGAGLAV